MAVVLALVDVLGRAIFRIVAEHCNSHSDVGPPGVRLQYDGALGDAGERCGRNVEERSGAVVAQ